jgi:hypothetical protein
MRHDFAGLVPGIAATRRSPKAQNKAKDNSDETLIAKVASGNRLAMQVLFARHHARVYRFILRLLGSETAAEDLTSEVFLGVWGKLTASRHARRSRPGCWPSPVTKRWPSCGAGRRRHRTKEPWTPAIRRTIQKRASRSSIGEKSCAIALPVCPRGIARSSISSTTTKNRCKRPPTSSAFPAIPSKPGCSTHARSSPSCSKREASWERCLRSQKGVPAHEGSNSEPSAATAASLSGATTLTPPRSSRIHPRLTHARSCLLVLSRDMPII